MRRRWGSIVVSTAALTALVAVCCASSASAAASLYVATTGTDTGNCQTSSSPCKTISYALNQAPSAATIQIAAGTYDENPLIGSSVSLVGASQTKTIIDGGGTNTTVTVIGAGATVNLSDLTIKGGRATQGGGISSDAQTLSLSHVTVSGNMAEPAGAGTPGQGGGIYLSGSTTTVTIANSKIMSNHAIGSAGKAGAADSGDPGSNGGEGMGGGIYDAGATLTLTKTTISKNTAKGGKGGAGGSWDSSSSGTGGNGGDGGTGAGGGIYTDDGPLTLTSSQVDSNTAQSGGGGNGGSASPGVGGDGGAADESPESLSADLAGGGGIYSGGASYYSHTPSVTITSSDVSSNKVTGGTGGTGGAGSASGGAGGVWTSCGDPRGGGIFMYHLNAGPANTGNLTITSSTIENNTLTGCNGGKGGSGSNGQANTAGGAGGAGGGANPVWGGGIFYLAAYGETLSIKGSTISGNVLTAGHAGGGGKGGNGGKADPGMPGRNGGAGGNGGSAGAAYGGGVFYGSSEYGNFAIAGSTVSGNSVTSGKGGDGGAGGGGSAAGSPGLAGGNGGNGGNGQITTEADGGGVATFTSGASIQLSDSTFANNGVTGGAGGGGAGGGDGGAGTPNGTNGASGAGQNGSNGQGGGIYSRDATVLTNDTVAGNVATGGQFGSGQPSGSLGNGIGGGVWNGSLQLANTIIATNTVATGITAGPDCNTTTGSATSLKNNLIGDISFCSGITNGVNGDQTGNGVTPLDPLLGPLADNGGPTQTMALKPGSPAIATGLGSTCTGFTINDVDERGFPRRTAARGGVCDIGAYDTSEPVSFAISAPPSATAGQAFTVTVTAKDAFGNTLTGYLGRIVLTSTDPAATLPKGYTFKASNHGVHSFSVTLATSGSQTVSVKDTAAKAVTGTSSAIAVTP